MARSEISRQRVVVRQSYYWPDQQLNFWIIIMLATGGVLIGVFAQFIIDQQTLGGLGIPWYVAPVTSTTDFADNSTGSCPMALLSAP